MTPATHLDLYQLTSLVTHAEAGHLHDPVVMSFFSRKMPEDPVTDEPRRVRAGHDALAHAEGVHRQQPGRDREIRP